MATTVQSIFTAVDTVTVDEGGIRWPADEKLLWLNEGQVELVKLKPQANTKVASVQLVAGVKQSLPADGIALLDMPRNMGANGSTPGDAILSCDRKTLDAFSPGWASAAASGTVKHFMYDLALPKVIFVYPQQPASPAYAELIYSAIPAACTANGNISLPDQYAANLINYILYRAFSKDAEFAGNADKAAAYYKIFAE